MTFREVNRIVMVSTVVLAEVLCATNHMILAYISAAVLVGWMWDANWSRG